MEPLNYYINKYKYLFLSLLFFTILRAPSLYESFWYGDEGIYGALAQGMHQGKALYTQIWDHKPPLLYWFYYLAGFGNWTIGLVLIRAASLLFGIGAIIILYKVLQQYFKSPKVIALSLFVFSILIGLPVLEGNIANAEVFFIFFNLLILYLLQKDKWYIGIGLLAFLSFAIKTPSFVESVFILLAFALILFKEKGISEVLKKAAYIILGFLTPLLLLSMYLFIQGTLGAFIQGAFVQSFLYSSELAENIIFFGYSVPPTPFKILVFILVLAILFISYIKSQVSRNLFIILTVVTVEIFASFLSGRNYPHYLIQALPGLTLLLAYTLSKLRRNELFNNFKYLLLLTVFYQLVIITFTAGKPLNVYTNSIAYYKGFVTDVLEKKNTGDFWWRDGDCVRRIKSFSLHLNNNYKDYKNYYLYTNEAWIFALTEKPSTNKFVVWYHLGFNPEFMQESIELRDKSDLFIVDETTPKKNEFFKDMDKFEKLEEFERFTIYKKVR